MKKILMILCGLLLSLCVLSIATASTIYSNNFEGTSDLSKWTNGILNTTSVNSFPSTQYLGDYSLNSATTLTLTGLSAHTELTLDFDLYLFNTWDGNNINYGLDFFSLSQDINGSWTFTNHQAEGQTYNGTPDVTYGSGAAQTMVYRDLGPTGADNGFTIAHTSDTFTVTFGGPTTQSDEWWGIDNVSVSIDSSSSAIPEPATMILFGVGLMGLARVSRRKR